MIRVVVDTNVLVSALLKENGAEAAVLFDVAEKTLRWCVSPRILAEYESVLRRPKFSHVSETYITPTSGRKRGSSMRANSSRHSRNNHFDALFVQRAGLRITPQVSLRRRLILQRDRFVRIDPHHQIRNVIVDPGE
jgi:predicted nucleic acid-binding protein